MAVGSFTCVRLEYFEKLWAHLARYVSNFVPTFGHQRSREFMQVNHLADEHELLLRCARRF